MNKKDLSSFIDMAAGRRPAELLITNCRIVDVFNQKLLDGPLALAFGKVVGWGPGLEGQKEIDAQGGIVMPGLIDGHVHIESSALTPAQFAKVILPFGTTTVVADPHEIANVCGLDGLRYMLAAARRLPLDVRLMLPSCVPATPYEQSGAELSADDLEHLIDEEGVWGLGEVMDFNAVVNHSDGMMEKILMARRHGRVIDGHSPGLSGTDLRAYAAAGIMTDHECVGAEDMWARLRLGQYILMRKASSTNDLPALIKGLTPANARRCVLCTDDREAADILAEGHLNASLRECVALGVDPLLAITFGTLNAAECFRLKGKGAIAPGWKADLAIVRDLKDFQVSRVFVAGREVAEDGRLTVQIDDFVTDEVRQTVRLAPLGDQAFELPLKSDKVRAIGVLPDSILTLNKTLTVKRDARGCFDPALNPGLNKIAVIERHRASGKMGLGILADYGIKNGALAVTVAHDSHNLVVAGDNDADMLAAVNDVRAIGGGYSLVQKGRVLANLPLPVAGLMSDRPAREVADSLEKLVTAARRDLDLPKNFHPLMKLIFMTLPVIPELKLTSNGLFDVSVFRLVDVSY